MKIKPIKIKTIRPDLSPVPIVADGAISSREDFGGRLIPLVILDTSARPDVEECIRVHHELRASGDVRVQWGQIDGKEGTIVLFLTFIRPTELTLLIEFSIVGQSILVNQALHGKALYIQAGRPGDRLKNDINKPKIIIEVVEVGFQPIWNALLQKQYARHFRTQGLNRSDSRRAAARMVEELQNMSNLRMQAHPAKADL